jgi:hypothetical protein
VKRAQQAVPLQENPKEKFVAAWGNRVAQARGQAPVQFPGQSRGQAGSVAVREILGGFFMAGVPVAARAILISGCRRRQ